MSRSLWIKLSVLVTVLGVAALAWAFRPKSEVQVATAAVTDGPMTRRVIATGSLQAVTTVEIGSQVSGIVQSLLVDYNSFVKAGEIVARLDPSLYDAQQQAAQAALAQSEAALAQARANVLGYQTALEDANQKLTRAKSLSERDLIPRSDLDAANIAVDSAKADLGAGIAGITQAQAAIVQAKAALEQAEVNVQHTVIRSPIDGIVVDRDVDVGQTLAASVSSPVLFRIAADLTKMQVQVNVDESDVGVLAPGEDAAFDVETFPGETFHGKVSQVRLQPVTEASATATTVGTGTTTTAPAATSSVATIVSYTAIVDVANPDERLRPGMTAEVVLSTTSHEHATRIPNTALSFRPPEDVLKLLGETEPALSKEQGVREVWAYDGKRFTPIAVHGGIADGGWTELVSGNVHAGDNLVTSAVVGKKVAR